MQLESARIVLLEWQDACVSVAGNGPEAIAQRLGGDAAAEHREQVTPEQLVGLLGIKAITQGARSVDDGNAVLYRNGEGQIKVGPRSNPGRRSRLVAHELGHWVLDRLLEDDRVPEPFRVTWSPPAAQEIFARRFADTLLEPLLPVLPSEISAVEEQIFPGSKRLVAIWRARGGPILTIHHLAHLARAHKVSVRQIVSRLRGGTLLARTSTAVLIYRQIENQHTLRDKGIRLWQKALPPWGFIPWNQRAWKHGITDLLDIYLTGKNFQTKFHTQREIRVKVQTPTFGHCQYKSEFLCDVVCATTPVDVDAEGRYLVTMFSWPMPIGWE